MNLEDKIYVAEWLGVEVEKVKVEIEIEPIDKFIKQITEAMLSYANFPKDKKRTDRIVKLLKDGAPVLPVYVEKSDNNFFIMEGRHRIVAFYILGIKEIPVAKCSVLM